MTPERKLKLAKAWWSNLEYDEQRYYAETYYSTTPENLTDNQIIYLYEC